MVENFKNYINRLKLAAETLEEGSINLLYSEIEKRINTNSSIYILGNGGSSANASHVAGDFTKTLTMLGLKINIVNAAENNCYVTATSNDIDFSEIYSTLVGIKICKDDLIIYLTGSGNSINLVKCAQKAKQINITQIGILGYSGGRIKELVDVSIHIKINDMEISEDIQLIIFHHIKQKLFEKYKNKNISLDSGKYDKRIIEDVVS